MTKEKIRIAIGSYCGWTKIQQNPRTGVWFAAPPKKRKPQWDVLLPDYCNSLDAMAEAEKCLTDAQFMEYTKGMPPCAYPSYRADRFLLAIKPKRQ